jgi:hypothetical protein
MAFDIYGQPLRPGHCEVHPHVGEPYPCTVCLAYSGHPLAVALRDALRAVVGNACEAHQTAPSPNCAVCRAVRLLAENP